MKKEREQKTEIQVIGKTYITDVIGEKQLPLSYFIDKYAKAGFHDYNLFKGMYYSGGFRYDLRPHLKRFVIWQNGDLNEYFSPNAALLKRCIGGKIAEIQEIRNPYLGTTKQSEHK